MKYALFFVAQLPKTFDLNTVNLTLEVARVTQQFNGSHFYSPHKLFHVETIDNEAIPTNPIYIPIEAQTLHDEVFKYALVLLLFKFIYIMVS